MRINRAKSVFRWMLAVAAVTACAQEPAPLDARALVEAALIQRKADAASQTRYTNFRHVVETNRNEKGKQFYRWDRLFEETWINDLPYQRLVERDGHALKGKELAREQQLYDQAIQGRRPLGNTERIVLEGSRPVASGADLADALKPTYIVSDVGTESSPDGPLRVVLATREKSKSGGCSWRYRIWINQKTQIMRFHADVAPNDGVGRCGDAVEDETRILIDGIPKLATSHAHFYVNDYGDWTTVDSDVTFSKYRRFQATVTIGPATAVPE